MEMYKSRLMMLVGRFPSLFHYWAEYGRFSKENNFPKGAVTHVWRAHVSFCELLSSPSDEWCMVHFEQSDAIRARGAEDVQEVAFRVSQDSKTRKVALRLNISAAASTSFFELNVFLVFSTSGEVWLINGLSGYPQHSYSAMNVGQETH